MKKRIRFICNPVSGSEVGRYIRKTKWMKEKAIDRFLDMEQFEYDVFFTQESGHASEICLDAVEKGYDIIIAVGGDGTVNEVGSILIGTNIIMGIIPAGSGNGFSRHLKIPMHLKRALKVINEGNTIRVDTGMIRPLPAISDGNNWVHFICTAGIAFDAHMAEKFATMKKRGFWEYIKITAKEIFSYKSRNYKLLIDGEEKQVNAYVLTIANASQFGNNAVVSPSAKVTDGLLDVCIFNDFPFYKVFKIVFQLFAGTIDKSNYMKIYKAKKIIISKEEAHLQVDGDYMHLGKELEVKVNPLSLNILVPNKKDPNTV